jgi:hypothetical protein
MKVRKVPFDGALMLEDMWHLSLRYASDDRQLSCESKSGAGCDDLEEWFVVKRGLANKRI